MPEVVLLISAEPEVTRAVTAVCAELDVQLQHVMAPEQTQGEFGTAEPGVVLCDYEAFSHVHDWWPRASVLLYTDPAHSDEAIEAIKRGALDYVAQPIDGDALCGQIEEALRVQFEMGTVPLLLTGGFALAAVLWYVGYAQRRIDRRSALVHLVRRITSKAMHRSGLEDELRKISLERDNVEFDRLVQDGTVLDIKESISATELSRRVAVALLATRTREKHS